MGLFDGWQFDPQSYGGGAAGLFGGLLPQLQVDPRMAQGAVLGADQPTSYQQIGQQKFPVFGTPDPAALPPNAQPAQGQLPQAQAPQPVAPQQQNPFMGGLEGFISNAHTGPVGAILGGIGGAMGMGSQRRNATVDALVARGLDPAIAQQVARDPATLRSLLPSLIGGGQTDDIKEYQFAKREDPSLTFDKFMSRKKATSGEYSLTPTYATNEKGETVLLQMGKNGEPMQVKLPEGVKVSTGTDKLDLGTQWAIINKRDGSVIGYQPKNLREAEKQKEIGTAQGQASAKLPAVLIDAQATSKKIDDLLSNQGLDSIVGAFDQFRPSWTLGDQGRNALARLEQLQGGAFLQAFNTLKGGGAITEAEGRKAEQAIARMQRSQGEADFRIALQDFRDAVNDGVKKLQASAGETGSYPDAITGSQSRGSAPAPSVDDLVKKYSR